MRDYHGDSGTRLYTLWESMKYRVKMRENCYIYPCWNRFIFFKQWALVSGYQENLCLCRKRDVGNYCPNNVRWDSHGSNMVESHSRYWEVTTPEGISFCLWNLKRFCNESDLCHKRMSDVNYGKLTHHKGYTCKRIKQPYRLEGEYIFNKSLKDKLVPAKNNKPFEKYMFTLKRITGEVTVTSNLSDFCRVNGLERRNLSAVCNGRRKSCGGWYFVSKVLL